MAAGPEAEDHTLLHQAWSLIESEQQLAGTARDLKPEHWLFPQYTPPEREPTLPLTPWPLGADLDGSATTCLAALVSWVAPVAFTTVGYPATAQAWQDAIVTALKAWFKKANAASPERRTAMVQTRLTTVTRAVRSIGPTGSTNKPTVWFADLAPGHPLHDAYAILNGRRGQVVIKSQPYFRDGHDMADWYDAFSFHHGWVGVCIPPSHTHGE